MTRFQGYLWPAGDVAGAVAGVVGRWRGYRAAPLDLAPVPVTVPDELHHVFQEYVDGDNLARGGLRAAMLALFGDQAPTGGPPFIKAKDEIHSHLQTYLLTYTPSPQGVGVE